MYSLDVTKVVLAHWKSYKKGLRNSIKFFFFFFFFCVILRIMLLLKSSLDL
jgi:hypothetical protein